MSARWFRLDTTWSSSEWLAALPPNSRLVWVELLCYVKAHGYDGRVRAVSHSVFASRHVTGVTRDDVTALIDAAKEDDALRIEGDEWVITGWQKRNGDPTAADRQKRYRNAKSRLSPLRQSRVTDSDETVVTPTETETETSKKAPTEPKKTPARKRALPDDWQPNDSHIAKATELRVNLEAEAKKFRTHAIANGRKMVSWDAAFAMWLTKAHEFAMPSRANGTTRQLPNPQGFATPEELGL